MSALQGRTTETSPDACGAQTGWEAPGPLSWLAGEGNGALLEVAGMVSKGASWIEGAAEDIYAWLTEPDEGECIDPWTPESPVNDGVEDDGEREGKCAEAEAPYLNQRDNETERMWDTETGEKNGDAQCTPTSTAMVLLGLLGEEGFRNQARAAFEQRGQPMDPGWFLENTPEHVVWEYVYLRDRAAWCALLGVSAKDFTLPLHTSGPVMRVVIEEIAGAPARFDDQGRLDPSRCKAALEALPSLPSVVGTNMTGSGHTVVVKGVFGGGVLVQDPYGAYCEGAHLKNGETGSPPPPHRWEFNPKLQAVDPTVEAREDWGEDNFFTWDEVTALGIGKWVAGLVQDTDDV